MKLRKSLLIAAPLLFVAATVLAGDVDKDVAAALSAEKAGFNARDCDAALVYWTDGPLMMVVDGKTRARSKDEMAQLCLRIMANLPPDIDNRETVSESVHVLSKKSAYTITEYPDGAMVTKIWKKKDAGWRIVHLHESTVSPAGPPAPPPAN